MSPLQNRQLHVIKIWFIIFFSAGLITLLGITTIGLILKGELPPFINENYNNIPNKAIPDEKIDIAGSGATLPIVNLLLTSNTIKERLKDINITLHPSIGSTGGIQALKDNSIDIALISRPLAPKEKDKNLITYYLTTTQLVVVSNKTVNIESLTKEELNQFIRYKTVKRLPQLSKAQFLLREKGDSGNKSFIDKIPSLSDSIEYAYKNKSWKIYYSDDEFYNAFSIIKNSIGFGDLCLLNIFNFEFNIIKIKDVGEIVRNHYLVINKTNISTKIKRVINELTSKDAKEILKHTKCYRE